MFAPLAECLVARLHSLCILIRVLFKGVKSPLSPPPHTQQSNCKLFQVLAVSAVGLEKIVFHLKTRFDYKSMEAYIAKLF